MGRAAPSGSSIRGAFLTLQVSGSPGIPGIVAASLQSLPCPHVGFLSVFVCLRPPSPFVQGHQSSHGGPTLRPG